MHTNGGSKKPSPIRRPTYRGHSREEVTRILIQGLVDMGYQDSAHTLISESGFELESAPVAAFRNAILEGDWTEAEGILVGTPAVGAHGALSGDDQYGQGLVLAEGADKGQMLFWIRQQKYLELLDQRDLGMALMVLRQELTPLNRDIQQLNALSSLLMCPAEDLRCQAEWPETLEESRSELLQALTRSIAPSVMLRDHRLAELLDQVKQAQINQCLYHNTSVSPSLYSDHMCNRENFPSRSWLQLEDHDDEVWHVQFSHDGTKLATASADRTVYVYETNSFKRMHKLTQHHGEVTYLAWSPDSTKLITCSKDSKARVWDIISGRILMTVEHRTAEGYFVSSASWAPDSATFVTSSHDMQAPLCCWNMRSLQSERPLYSWPPDMKLRANECAITADGQRLIVISNAFLLYVFDMHTYREEYRMSFPFKLTGMSVSRDSETMLVNMVGKDSGEVHLVEIATGDTIRRFKGHKQGEFVIRNSFGGAGENFVLSGSEGKHWVYSTLLGHWLIDWTDGKVYIWHKENGALIEALGGHDRGSKGKHCVTTVSWNPRDPGMFASGGDDRKVKMYVNSFMFVLYMLTH